MKNVVKISLVVAAIIAALAIGSRAQLDPAYEGGWTTINLSAIVVIDPVVGDVNRDGVVSNADVVAMRLLRRYIHIGDVNGDNKVNEADETYLINHVLYGGDAPKPRTRCRSIRVDAYCLIEGEPLGR